MRHALPTPGMSTPLLRALGAQAGGIAMAVVFGALCAHLTGRAPAGWQWLLVQALAAGAIARLLRLEWWWWLLSLGFGPALAAGMATSMPPAVWALLLGVLVLAYGGTQRTRVPLYLSNGAAVGAFVASLPDDRPLKVLDLGCGTGTILAAIVRRRPLAVAEGIERAPLPWLVAKLRSLADGGRSKVRWGNLWSVDLSGHDVVYAFLSPAPMPQLWEKARREMRPGSLLVSFRFEIPGVAPDLQLEAGPGRLYAWRM